MASQGNVLIIDDDDDYEEPTTKQACSNLQQTAKQMVQPNECYEIARPNVPPYRQADGDSSTNYIHAGVKAADIVSTIPPRIKPPVPQRSAPPNIPKQLPQFGKQQTTAHEASASKISDTEETSTVEDNRQKLHDNVGAPQRRQWAGKPKMRKGRPRSGNFSVGKEFNATQFPCKVEEAMSAVKVTMLIIKGFGKRHRSSTVNINLDERNMRVIIETQSEEEMNTVQIRMRECLEQIRTRKRVTEKNVAKFLATDPCRKCLREKMKGKKIGAVIDAQEQSCELVGYAFTEENLGKAFNVLDETLITSDIQLQTHDREAVKVSINKISQNTTQLTSMFVSSATVKIISLVEREVDEIQAKIRNLMKDCKPKEERASVELHNAKARCFNQHFSNGLQVAVRDRNGQYLPPEQTSNGDEVKVTITVIGEPGIKDVLEHTVNKIWKERFDFAKVSTDADDKWLLVKGLSEEEGRTFLKHCEVNFDCFIDQLKEGTVRAPTGKSRVTVQTIENSDTSSSSDDDVSWGTEATFDYDTGPIAKSPGRSIGAETYIQLQGPRAYDDAMAQAIQASKESSGLNRPHIPTRGFGQLRDISYPSFDNEADDSDRRHIQAQMAQRVQRLFRPSHAYGIDRSGMNTSIHSENINGMQIHILKGDITKEKAEALVNVVSPNMDFGNTAVSIAFKKAAGQQLELSYEAQRQQGLNTKRVIITPGGGTLTCKVVLHVGLIVGKDNCTSCLSNVIPQLLQECENSGCKSIALSPLGLGRMYKYEDDDSAEQTFLSLSQYYTSGILQDIKIVVYDDQALQVFTAALKSAAQSGTSSRVKLPDFVRKLPHLPMSPPAALQQQLGLTKPQMVSRQSNQAVSNKPVAPHFYRNDGKSGQQERSASSKKGPDDKSSAKRPRSSRVKYQAVTDINISVFAKDRSTCINALKEMEKKMKQDLLLEKKFERVPSLSTKTKSEIAKVIDEHNILSIKEKDHYLLKGKSNGVLSAHSRIMEILLKNPKTSTIKRRTENTKRETLEFARAVAQEEPMVPTYWKHYNEGETLAHRIMGFIHKVKGQDYEKVDIPNTSRTYSKIVRMIMETTDASVIGQGKDASGLQPGKYSKLWVTKIQRIENLSLFRKYCQKRQSLFEQLVKQGQGAWPKVEKLPKSSGPIALQKLASSKMVTDLHSEINEVLLFHGTKEDTIDTICQGGLDPRLGSGKAMFGPGVYGAEKALKADQYTDDPTSRTYGQGNSKKMFLMRMLLGQCFLCVDQNPTKYKRAPCCTCFSDVCKQHPQRFDSVIGDNQKLFREFVVYDGGQCYPEYLITYERR